MKIQKLRFMNLNSLAGEWEVDLTHPDYVTDGIFAITGPTGSGKSTLLDALCLALYGRTPRLDKVTTSENEIMTRRTGSCFAEATFETARGRFRCRWGQHRARNRQDGKLQNANHELVNADDGKLIESTLRDVPRKVEELTGMDFKRFTRSMLLAQGAFAEFLQASKDERAPILEQITGTGQYSEISIKVHERERKEQEALRLLKAEASGLTLLEAEEESELRQELAEGQKEEQKQAGHLKATEQALQWLGTIAQLKKDIAALLREDEQLQKALQEFQPQREVLERGNRAATLDGQYAQLEAARKQLKNDRTSFAQQQAEIPVLEKSADAQSAKLNLETDKTSACKKEQLAAAPLLQKVRLLDQKLAERKKELGESREILQQKEQNIAEQKRVRKEAKQKLEALQQILSETDKYLLENERDRWLVGGLTGLEVQLESLLTLRQSLQQREKQHDDTDRELKKAQATVRSRLKEVEVCLAAEKKQVEQLSAKRNSLELLLDGRLLREYRNEREALQKEMTLLARIASLEDHRKELQKGMPCPLCGALEHPYADDNLPEPGVTENRIAGLDILIKKAETLEEVIQNLTEEVARAGRDLIEAEKSSADIIASQKVLTERQNKLKQDLQVLRLDFDDNRKTLVEKLQPLGVEEVPEGTLEELLMSLRRRLESWQKNEGRKTEIERQIGQQRDVLGRLDAKLETEGSALEEDSNRFKRLESDYEGVVEERQKLFENRNPDEEEKKLQRAVIAAEQSEAAEREKFEKLNDKLKSAKTKSDDLEKRIASQEPQLTGLESTFRTALAPLAFEDEQEFLAARLPVERRTELDLQAGKLQQRQTELEARSKDRNERLAIEMKKEVTDKAEDELKPQLDTLQEQLKTLREKLITGKNKLADNELVRQKLKEKQEVIEKQTREYQRWKNLHELIGSADGKKYRNFAQGLTFEVMVSHANKQLRKMSDRYLLVRDENNPLELNVIDIYQNGVLRSTKNLSGGESFIVSLSLALGLSQMASTNVRVDSLFLDEGFGTLDEDSLDTALTTLAGLKQEDKLIGVISHVTALKERIGTQIQVEPLTEGNSRISGPGCRKV